MGFEIVGDTGFVLFQCPNELIKASDSTLLNLHNPSIKLGQCRFSTTFGVENVSQFQGIAMRLFKQR